MGDSERLAAEAADSALQHGVVNVDKYAADSVDVDAKAFSVTQERIAIDYERPIDENEDVREERDDGGLKVIDDGEEEDEGDEEVDEERIDVHEGEVLGDVGQADEEDMDEAEEDEREKQDEEREKQEEEEEEQHDEAGEEQEEEGQEEQVDERQPSDDRQAPDAAPKEIEDDVVVNEEEVNNKVRVDGDSARGAQRDQDDEAVQTNETGGHVDDNDGDHDDTKNDEDAQSYDDGKDAQPKQQAADASSPSAAVEIKEDDVASCARDHPEVIVIPDSDVITVPDSDAPGPSTHLAVAPDTDGPIPSSNGTIPLDEELKPILPPPRRTVQCKAREPATLKPMFLPPVTAAVENDWVCLFFRFCVERHKMYERRKAGVDRDKLTEDETMQSLHIGNVFRQLDPGSSRIEQEVMSMGEQSHTEICFRVFLFCMFYNYDTWKTLCAVAGGVPTWKNFEADMPAMEAALYERTSAGHKIYLGGFQLVPPTVYFTNDRNRSKSMHNFAASLRLVLAMMKAGLPDKLLECKYAVDASYVLQTIPTLGGFLSLNILCFLNDNHTPYFNWPYRNFATCGPGSRMCLQRMFGKETINSVAMEEAGLVWLAENQWKYYARLGLDPPHEWENGLRPGMRVLDIENALCWCHRYIAAFEKKGLRSFADEPLPRYDPLLEKSTGPPAWVIEEKWRNSTSRARWDSDHKEEDDRLFEVDGQEDVYEVEKVITRKSTRPAGRKDVGLFRVRWKGWTPEEDTWESAAVLRDGAEEALQEWIDWEDAVWGAIEDIKVNKPYKKLGTPTPEPQAKHTPKKRKVDVEEQPRVELTREERAAKRARRSLD